MATEVGTAYAAIIPSAKGFARGLQKAIAKEFAGSNLDKMIAEALAGAPVTLPVRPEFRPGDLPDELPTRSGREPTLPVQVDPVTDALRADLRKQLAAITREITASVEVTPDTDELRTELSAALIAIEASLSADIPTEPGDRREYERQLREQVDAVSRTVRARIDADVRVDADSANRNGSVGEAGDTVGRSLASRVSSAFSGALSAVPAPLMFAPVIAAAGVAAPLAGAAIAGGILAALGGGVIALGILGVKDDPRFQAAASDLGATIKTTLTKAAGPLLGTEAAPGPLLRAMETLKQLVIDIGPSLEEMFKAIGPYLPGLAEGIAAFVKEAMPGLVDGVKAAGPLLEVIALNMGPLGESVGQFLSVMAELGPAAADAFNVIFFLVTSLIDAVGGLLYVLGAVFSTLFQNVKDAWDGIQAAWAVITAAFSAGVAAARRHVEGFVAGALRLWRNLTDRLTGGTRAALNTVTSFFGGLPGRIRGAVGNLGNLLFQAGRNVVQGLINGLRSMFGALGNAAGGLAGTIRNYLPFSPAKEGPLSGRGNPFYSGRSIVELLASGITGNLGAARAAASDLAGTFALGGSPLAAAPSAPYGLAAVAPAPAQLRAEWVGGDGDPIVRAIRESVRIYYGGSPAAAFGS